MKDPEDDRDPRGRFAPGRSGHPKGRPAGARNNASLVAESLLAGAAASITNVAIRKAMQGNIHAVKLCLERLLAVRRERAVRLKRHRLEAGDATAAATAMADLYSAAAQGVITPAEAESLANLVLRQVDLAGYQELQRRVIELEALMKDERPETRSDEPKKKGRD